MSRTREALSGLLDVRFERMVTPALVGCLYLALITCAGIGSLVGVLVIWGLSSWMGDGWWWFAPLVVSGGIVSMLAARVACEWVLMAFTRGRPINPAQPPSPGSPPPSATPSALGGKRSQARSQQQIQSWDRDEIMRRVEEIRQAQEGRGDGQR